MNYQDIQKVNSEIKMLDLKGKDYAMVPERVTAFRKLYPDGFITTEIIANDGTTVLMKASVGYYKEDGTPVILGSGMAQEIRGKGMVNGTSHIENCETSAVGRALGMMGLGINGGGICSAEELANAVTAQRQMKEEKKLELQETPNDFTPPNTVPVNVTQGTTVPSLSEEMKYLNNALSAYAEEKKVTIGKAKAEFKAIQIKTVKDGVSPNKALADYTKEEIKLILDLMKAGYAA